MLELELRLLKEQDAAALARLESTCFSQPWSIEACHKELTENALARYWGCLTDGALIGFIGYWLILDEAHVTNVAVQQNFRQQGLGRLLMEQAEHMAKLEGARWMTLEVRVSNTAARKLYAGLGFDEAGIRKGYYEDPVEDAAILWKNLSPCAKGEAPANPLAADKPAEKH